jgi:tRNA and rRNA cytosine-C5-methylases
LRNYIKRKNEYFLDNNKKETYSLLSHPIWLVNRWMKKYGYKKTLDICDFNNSEQTVWFRVNSLKYIKEILSYVKRYNENINFHPLHELFFNASNTQRLIKSNLFNDGKISVQNPINGFIVDLLNPKNNDVILDGCGAPGGKGTFISHKAPKAQIFSIDNNKKRIELFVNSAKRQKNNNIVFKYNDISKDSLPECNKILIDVPCTGTGVINRRVDIRWRRKLSDMKKIVNLQSRILENASKYLNLMVY